MLTAFADILHHCVELKSNYFVNVIENIGLIVNLKVSIEIVKLVILIYDTHDKFQFLNVIELIIENL